MATISKTFLVTITYDEDKESSHQFTDENLSKDLKVVIEATSHDPLAVTARRIYVPEEIIKPAPITLH